MKDHFIQFQLVIHVKKAKKILCSVSSKTVASIKKLLVRFYAECHDFFVSVQLVIIHSHSDAISKSSEKHRSAV